MVSNPPRIALLSQQSDLEKIDMSDHFARIQSLGNHDHDDVSLRSIVVGTLACIVVVVWAPLSEFLVGASRLNLSQLPVVAMGLFFGVVLLNSVVGRIAPVLRLRPAELITVFSMAFVGSIVATSNLLNWPLGIMSVPYYVATPENRWMSDLWPYLRQWAVVQGPRDELRWAFVGMPDGAKIPWGIWIVPMFWWGTFLGAVALVAICLASLLRKQWADNERLAFPLVQVPLELITSPSGKWGISATLRKRSFWVGAAIPLFVILFNCLNYFLPQFPRLPVMDGISIQLGPNFPAFGIKLNMYVLGFAYLVNTNVLFSVWFWDIILVLESGFFRSVGYTLGDADDPYSSRDALTSWQGFGGFIVFVLVSLWMARNHLKMVWYAVIGKIKADDENELLSYRWAVIGLFVAVVYMTGFMVSLGMSWKMALVFLFGAFVAYLGTTRVIAQTGLVYMQSPLTPTMFTFGAFGTVGVPAQEIVGMVGTYSLVVNGRAPFMPAIFHISWLGAKIGARGRRMLTVLIVALIVAYACGSFYYLMIAYNEGATTFRSTHFAFHGEQVYNMIIQKMQARVAVDPGRWTFLGAGALVMSILTYLQYRFPAWPLHPIGFPIAAANNVHRTVFAIFLAWLIKTIILKIGGVEAYERGRPVFIGMAAGYALGILLSFFVDWMWFPGAGHQIHNW